MALLALLLWFTVGGAVEVARDPAAAAAPFATLLPTGLAGLVGTVALVFVSYAGVGQVASVSEEGREPARTLPRGMLLALAVATAFYVAGTAIMVALVPLEQLSDDPVPVASTVAAFAMVPLPVVVVVVGALAAFASTGNAAILSAARYPLAMARDGLLWGRFARLDAQGVPRTAVLTTSAVIATAVLLLDVEGIARAASAFLLLVFAGVCGAVLVFRESRLDTYQPGFTSPLYPGVQIAGLVIYPLLIVGSGATGAGLVVGLVVLGGGWYAVLRRRGLARGCGPPGVRAARRDRRAAPDTARSLALAPRRGTARRLLDRAMVLEGDAARSLEELARGAADALVDRVGGDRDALAHALVDGIRPWASPDELGVVVSPVPMEGIEQPEMVVARVAGGTDVDGRSATGFVFLVDDVRHAARLLELVSQLTATVRRRGFRLDLDHVADADDLRAALRRDVRTVSVVVRRDAAVVGRRLAEVDLPAGSLVALLRREGATSVPDGEVRLRPGDQVVLLVESDVADEAVARF
jgi:basic amino acid/polyamine antiporter, APA family